MFVSKAKAFPSRVDFGCFPIDKASDFWKGLLVYLASSSMTEMFYKDDTRELRYKTFYKCKLRMGRIN
jgi:hypothetical protein